MYDLDEAAKQLYEKAGCRFTQKWEHVSEIIKEKWRAYAKKTSTEVS